MGHKTGKEMRALMLAVSLPVLALVIAIVAYFMIDVVASTNANIERNQELVVEQSTLTLAEIGEDIQDLTTKSELFSLFNPDIATDILAGKIQTLYDFITKFCITFYPIDFVGVINDGELVSFASSEDYDINPYEMPLQPSGEGSQRLDEFSGHKGYFVSQFFDVDLSMLGIKEFYVNMIVDRTKDMAEIKDYFEGQRNALVLRLSIASAVAIILSLLLTTLGLRYFTRKYVVKPIEELNRAAEEIVAGEFRGDVEVDEKSAYAALQGLLRSGQKVLQRFDEEMGG